MGISVTKLLIILVIIIVIFGTKRLKNIGSDLGETIKGFRDSLRDGEESESKAKSAEKKEDINNKDDTKV